MPVEAAASPSGSRVAIAGPGFGLAEATARREIAASRPDVVISMGTCGALRPEFTLGQVFTANRILSPLGEFAALPLKAPTAVIYSQDRVAATAVEKAHLASLGGDLVEMESAAIARVCRELNVPFACIKAVSDTFGEDLPLDFNLYRSPDGHFQTARIAFAGIMKLGGLRRIERQTRLAVEKLGEALAHVL